MSRVLLIALVWVLISVPASAAPRLKCSYCGKTITGKYYKFEAHGRALVICETCHRTCPRCALCGMPIRRPRGWDGKKGLYCPDCFKNRTVCDICGKTIKGKFFKSENTGETYCENCHRNAPKCASCRKPLKRDEQTIVHGQRICSYCSEGAPKCDCCELPIVGPKITYRFADGSFCSYCDKNRPHCYVCGVPVADDALELSDDRLMCPECAKSAVLTTATLRLIHGRAVGFLRRKVDMDVDHDYGLKLARSRRQLGGRDRDVQAKEQGLFTNAGGKFSILILKGATESMCYETVAHEYAHAWHAEHGMENADQEIREGFAQWAASKVLEHFGYEKGLRRLRARRDPDYGTGYQIFAAVEKRKGVKGVFQFLAEKSRPRRPIHRGKK